MSSVTTPTEVRLSYTNLLSPRAQSTERPDDLTYSTAILIPKSDTATVELIRDAVKEALAEGVTKKWGGKRPNGLKNPLRDGDADRPDDEVYAGHYFINAKGPRGGQEKPILLDSRGEETSSDGDIYSGVFGLAALQFYPYDKNGNKGVAAGLSAFQSAGHGDPLGNTVTVDSARKAFGITTPASDAKDAFAGTKASEPEASSDADADDPWES